MVEKERYKHAALGCMCRGWGGTAGGRGDFKREVDRCFVSMGRQLLTPLGLGCGCDSNRVMAEGRGRGGHAGCGNTKWQRARVCNMSREVGGKN